MWHTVQCEASSEVAMNLDLFFTFLNSAVPTVCYSATPLTQALIYRPHYVRLISHYSMCT
jgi:hypothetical protein